MSLRPLALSVLLSFALPSFPQTATPHDRLVHATEASSLSTLSARPWHAKLAVTLFDEKGQNPVEGTIEYWRSGEDWRRVISVGESTATFLRHEGNSFHSTAGPAITDVARDLFDDFLHPGPIAQEIDRSILQAGKQKFGNITLDCVMLGSPVKGAPALPLGLFQTYCLDPAGDHLRVRFAAGSDQLTINKIGQFLDHDVPMEFALGFGNAVIGKAKVVSMATFTPASDTFLPTPELTALPAYGDTALISSGVMQSRKMKTAPPIYPVEARMAHLSGTVLLRAVIGTDGKVRSLKVISTPDPSLAGAALAAVRQWTYKPYILNGEPTEVDTTVVVNFSLNGN